ncbi:MAG: hypothetical protein VKO39_03905 [Cyanobacteriota bacterium]|nr:hypothetical protein [Cyanobacteriota bacterium]
MGHVFSCVVDSQPIYYFQAWNLIHSLIGKADVKAEQIIVNFTPNVDPDLIREIKQLNCHVRFIEPFGDKKYCNKIAQLDQDIFHECDGVFLLDLDMIVLANIDHLYHPNMICGKVVLITQMTP